jgi:hypothetical protein
MILVEWDFFLFNHKSAGWCETSPLRVLHIRYGICDKSWAFKISLFPTIHKYGHVLYVLTCYCSTLTLKDHDVFYFFSGFHCMSATLSLKFIVVFISTRHLSVFPSIRFRSISRWRFPGHLLTLRCQILRRHAIILSRAPMSFMIALS